MTYEELIEKFQENHWGKLEVRCPDNATVIITPCSDYTEIKSIEDCDYFLVDGDLPWLGNSDLHKVVRDINNHAELVREANEEKDKLQKYFEEWSVQGWPDDTFSFYSDWHKDVYGYRPSRFEDSGIYVLPEYR